MKTELARKDQILKDFRDKLDTYMLQSDKYQKMSEENVRLKQNLKKMKSGIERKD